MKKRNLYVMCGVSITACVIYTLASFTAPTKKHQEQSVFTNALQLVDQSFRDIDEQDKSVIVEDNSFVLSSVDPFVKSTDEAFNMQEDTLSTLSLSEDEVSQMKEELSSSDDTITDDTKTKDKDEKEKKSEKDKKEKSDKREETKEDENVTIMSVGNKACENEDIAISIASSYVNIRQDANTESKILGKLYKNNAANILDKKGDWYYISSGNVKGYVKSEYVKSGLSEKELNQYGTLVANVLADGLNVREKASTDSKKLDVIYNNEKYPVLKEKEDWVKIHIEDDNIKGYVKSEFVQLTMSFTEAISIEEENALKKAEEEKQAKSEQKNNAPETVKGTSTDHTTDELVLLACLVHAEAGNQSYEGKLAVANVVLNRVKSSKYPNSIKNVIYQRGQFSVAKSGSLAKQLNNYDHYNSSSQKLSIQAAKDALAGVNNIGKRLSFNRYSKSVEKKHSKNGVKIDDQFFW